MKRLALVPIAFVLSAMVQDGSPLFESGEWEITVHMTDVEMPGAPSAVLETARSSLPPPRTQRRCMSPEEAVNPAAYLVNGMDSSCTFSRAIIANGVIELAASCARAGRVRVDMVFEGSFTPGSIDVAIQSIVDNDTMRLRGTMTARRIGICSPEAG